MRPLRFRIFSSSRVRRVLYVLEGYGAVVVGALITALSLDWFTVPNRIAAGGISGLATITYYLWGLPVGLVMLALNVPLFLAAVRVLGHEFGIKSIIGTVALSLFTDLLAPYTRALTHDPLLAALYGGVLSGIGLGITFKWGGSTGGTDLAALLWTYYRKSSVGWSLLIVDFGIITLSGVVFSPELALWALLSLFISSRAVDVVQEGLPYAKAAYVITDRAEAIAQAVMTQLERGVTAFHGVGMYTQQERPVLFIIVARAEIADLKRIVSELDPDAFMVISDTHEVLGEGFRGMRRTGVK